MYYLCTMCIGLWPAAPRNLKKWPMANFELETPAVNKCYVLKLGLFKKLQYNE